MIKNIILSIILSTTLITINSTEAMEGLTIRRAALDIGSGGTKVTVADVDPHHNKIVKIHYSKEVPVHLKRDMLNSGQPRFSDAIQQKFIDALMNYKTELTQYEPMEWSGVGTAAARQSENAQEMFDRAQNELGINLKIIPQEEEGRVGFNTAVAVSGIPEDELIAYDSGSGSFQLTTMIDGKLEVVQGDFAFSQAWDTLYQEVRGLKKTPITSPNPISFEEAQKVVPLLQKRLPQMSKSFAAKLICEETTVVGIGNQNFIFAIGAVAVGKNTYTKEELWTAIEAHCGKTDDQLKNFSVPQEVVIGMILLYSVMDGMGIDQLTYSFANGCCEGVLIDPAFWKKLYIMSAEAA